MSKPVDRAAVWFLKRLFRTPEGRAYALAQLAEAEGEGEGRLFEALERSVDPELQRLIRRHSADEQQHAAWLTERVRATGVVALEPPPHHGAIARIDEHMGLLSRPITSAADAVQIYAVLLTVEERMASQYPVFAEALHETDPESAEVLLRIQADELRHITYCKAIISRLAPDAEERAAAISEARRAEAAAFARHDYDALRFVLRHRLIVLPKLIETALLALTALRVALAPAPPPPPRPEGALFTEPTPEFYWEMRRRVDAWFNERGLARTGGAPALAKAALFGVTSLVSYVLVLRGTGGLWGMWALALLHGACLFLFALGSAHDASHGALVSNRRLNRLLWYCWDLAGASSWVTNLNHLKSHHVAPNVHGLDIAVGNEVLPLLRLHPDVPHRPWHRLQHLYFPLAYAMSTLHKWFVLDFVELSRNSFGNRRGQPGARRELAIMLAFKLFVLGWAVVVPLLVVPLPWWQIVIGLVSLHAIPGAIIGLTFQLTHISEGNEFPSADAQGRIAGSSALHNLLVNSDLLPSSRLLNWLSSGISIHLTHHLFPEVAHRFLPDIAPIVEQVAREYGVPYRKHTSLVDAVRAHARWLHRLSRPEALVGEVQLQQKPLAPVGA